MIRKILLACFLSLCLAARVSGQAVLEDFLTLRNNGDGDPLFEPYTGEDPLQTGQLDSGAYRVNVGNAPNAIYFHFFPRSGGFTYPNGYAQNYIKTGTWDPQFNRLRFWMKSSINKTRPSNGDLLFQVGTYVRTHGTGSSSNQGQHYYHNFGPNIYANRWMLVEVNRHPQHKVSQPGSTNWPDNPEAGVGYFDGLTRFYIDSNNDGYNNSSWWFDSFEFRTAASEPDYLVASVTAVYSGTRYEVAWAGPKNAAQSYDVRYKTTTMKVAGFTSGTDGGSVSNPNSDYTGTFWQSALMAEVPELYVAIRPAGSTDFTEIYIPTFPPAVTRYISPTGSDANSCAASATIGTPKLTFTSAIACMTAGDTLILRNGTYNSGNSGYLSINGKNGTAGSPITIKAENERQAFIDGNGSNPFVVLNSSYLVFEGIRVKNLDDDVNPAYGGQTIYVRNSTNLTFRRMLVTHNNRCYNGSIFANELVHNSLFEENEVYSFHRNGFTIGDVSNGNTLRRNYINSRGYADIGAGGACGAGTGYVSSPTTRGDGGFTVYPGSNNLFENNIAEDSGSAYDIQASATTTGNKFYGNMAVGSSTTERSFNATVRGSSLSTMPQNTYIENFVSVGATSVGMYLRGNKNTIFKQGTILGGTGVHGFAADLPTVDVGDGAPSVFLTNVLSSGNAGNGFYVASHPSWLINFPNSFGNTTAFSPVASHANITNETTTDPALGSCKAWIPSTSPMKGTGESGMDKGANILYQYQNGVLTGTKLWDTTTNNFTGCGVVVAGVNDIAGSSCTNVDIRLNIGAANGCAFPAGYGVPGSPGGDWISIDNFDSYTIGNSLSAGAGGSGWSGNWTEGTAAVTVGTAPAGGQGGGAFFVNADPNFFYSRTFADLSAGIVSFKFYITSATPADAIFILLDEATTSRGLISIDPDSNVKIFNGTARTNIGAYTANAWHTVTIEFDDAAQPNAFRAKLNAGVFSQWQPAANGGSYSVVNRLRIQPEGTTLFNAQLYIDDIREGSTASVVSTIALVDAGLTGSTMFVGEVKPLQWSSTDLTGNIDLFISHDSGATYQRIAQGVPDTGAYNWTVTGPASISCKVRVRSSSFTQVEDVSELFRIGGTHLTVR